MIIVDFTYVYVIADLKYDNLCADYVGMGAWIFHAILNLGT